MFFGLAVVLSFIGTAIAGTASIPVKKPESAPKIVWKNGIQLPLPKPAALEERAALADVADSVLFEEPPESLIKRVFDRLTTAKRLSPEDAARYEHIFAFQDTGNLADADVEIAKLEDRRLMGHVLYQRYLGSYYKTSYTELADWMRHYADHPQAQKIYDLALRKRPKDAALPAGVRVSRGLPGQYDFDVGQQARPYLDEHRPSASARTVMRTIDRNLGSSPTTALKHLDASRSLFSDTAYDAVLAEIAESYFYNNKIDDAYRHAVRSVRRSDKDVPLAGWIAGLSAWKLKKYEESALYFESAATSERSSAWLTSAAAYWAARAHLRARQPEEVSHWLRRSAEYPRTFYGIIAVKALGLDDTEFNWQVPELKDKHLRALADVPAGARAMALLDAGHPDMAAMELRRINPGDDANLQEALVSLAQKAGMPDLSLRMGSTFKMEDGALYDAALYPDVPWKPKKGFEVDRALVYAFIRQESRFDAGASNRSSGAKGLMQLMPSTARHVASSLGWKLSSDQLLDPETNIVLGQKYLGELLGLSVVDGNLFKLAVAYNAGPGKLARWSKTASYEDDPLMFVESIPSSETRMFVERVMTNFWIYRIKYDQNTESLDRVAEGEWPVYVAQDIRRGISFAAAATFFTR